MRYTSIRLYGELCSKTKEFNIAVDKSLCHNNMVTLLMHLCESDADIVKVGWFLSIYIKINKLLFVRNRITDTSLDKFA